MKNRKLRAPALIIIAALLLSLCACSAAGVGGSAGKLSLDYEQRAEEINSAAAGSGAVASGFVSVFGLVSDQISTPIAAARNTHPIASHSFLFFIKTFLLKYK